MQKLQKAKLPKNNMKITLHEKVSDLKKTFWKNNLSSHIMLFICYLTMHIKNNYDNQLLIHL